MPHSVHRNLMAIALLLGASSAVEAQQAPAPNVTTETFESWILTCVDRQETAVCEIDQNIADPNGRPLMQLQVGRFDPKSDDHVMLARFPVDVSVASPIVWSAGQTSVPLTLRACYSGFCLAEGRISRAAAETLIAADPTVETRFTLTRADGQAAAMPLSLTGFAPAWAAMLARTGTGD